MRRAHFNAPRPGGEAGAAHRDAPYGVAPADEIRVWSGHLVAMFDGWVPTSAGEHKAMRLLSFFGGEEA